MEAPRYAVLRLGRDRFQGIGGRKFDLVRSYLWIREVLRMVPVWPAIVVLDRENSVRQGSAAFGYPPHSVLVVGALEQIELHPPRAFSPRKEQSC